MQIDNNQIVTQEETGEKAPIDVAEERVERELDELEKKARDEVKEGLDATDI